MESKSQLTGRLKREGRWEAASQILAQQREQHVGRGVSPQDANRLAWEHVREQFPPLASDCEQLPPIATTGHAGHAYPSNMADDFADLEEEILAALVERSEVHDLERDRQWVYANLANSQVRPNDVPSLGAWAMLKWARANSHRFFESMMPRRNARQGPVEAADYLPRTRDGQDPATSQLRATLEKYIADRPHLQQSQIIVCPCCGTRLQLEQREGRTEAATAPPDQGHGQNPSAATVQSQIS
jgi:hypothetical protein